MRVATWNVNSIRFRHADVMRWLAAHRPDVLLVQETKCTDDAFAVLAPDYGALGYEAAHHGANHYNGVAILSRVGLDDVSTGFPGRAESPFDEPRLMSAVCGGVRMWTVYVPNGRKAGDPHWFAKVEWLRRLPSAIDVSMPTIVAGDVNVQRADIDVYDPRRWRNRNHATPEERDALAALIEHGLRDVMREHHPEPGVYTWWSYRPGQFEANRGMRIDLVLCTPELADRVDRVVIDRDERARPVASDHAPVFVDFRRP